MNPINKRKIGMSILLSFVTFGVYFIYWEYLLVKNIRALKKDESSCTGEMLCLVLVPFYPVYWWYTRGKTVRDEFTKNGYPVNSNETVFLILALFGLGIVAMAILQNDFNLLPDDAAASVRSNTESGTGKPFRKHTLVCPNCGVPIKRFDLSPNCKECGVHIMYFTQERDLARDAKKTELEFAKARELVSRIKAAFIGGKYPITRLVFMVLSVAALVVPYGSLSLSLPYYTQDISVGAIGAYNLYSSGFYTKLLSLGSLGIAEKPAELTLVWLGAFVFAVLAVLAQFVAYLLSFIKLRRGHKALAIIAGIGIAFNIAAAVMPFILSGAVAPYSFLTAKNGFGAFVSIAVLAVFLFLNVKMYKDNVQPEIKEVDLKRIEVATKVKSGEIDIDDLPLPIYETEEEREARLNALSGGVKKKKKDKKKKKGEKENG